MTVRILLSLLAVLLALPMTVFGFTPPTQTPNALIDAKTLKEWIDNGLVNKASGKDRVVILSIGPGDVKAADGKVIAAGFESGHIPGAIHVTPPELTRNRLEGVATASTMMLDGAGMDALIKKAGIDKDTTVVFTTSVGVPPWFPVRGYMTFRYWGFPSKQLKVLNGFDLGWQKSYPLASGASAQAAASTFSVRDAGRFNPKLRLSLGEMISKVGKPGNLIIDTRGNDQSPTYTGSAPVTLGVFHPAAVATGLVKEPLIDNTPDYTVFEGHIKGAKALGFQDLLVNPQAKDYSFKPTADLKKMFAKIGAGPKKNSIVYCRTGYIAAIHFFLLDGVYNWPVQLYDGSWSQWGQMSGNAAMGGKLPADSPWRTDTKQLTAPYPIKYNQARNVKVRTKADATAPEVITDTDFKLGKGHIEELGIDAAALKGLKPSDPAANQILLEDAAYMGKK